MASNMMILEVINLSFSFGGFVLVLNICLSIVRKLKCSLAIPPSTVASVVESARRKQLLTPLSSSSAAPQSIVEAKIR
jgi:hypothetical protein